MPLLWKIMCIILNKSKFKTTIIRIGATWYATMASYTMKPPSNVIPLVKYHVPTEPVQIIHMNVNAIDTFTKIITEIASKMNVIHDRGTSASMDLVRRMGFVSVTRVSLKITILLHVIQFVTKNVFSGHVLRRTRVHASKITSYKTHRITFAGQYVQSVVLMDHVWYITYAFVTLDSSIIERLMIASKHLVLRTA